VSGACPTAGSGLRSQSRPCAAPYSAVCSIPIRRDLYQSLIIVLSPSWLTSSLSGCVLRCTSHQIKPPAIVVGEHGNVDGLADGLLYELAPVSDAKPRIRTMMPSVSCAHPRNIACSSGIKFGQLLKEPRPHGAVRLRSAEVHADPCEPISGLISNFVSGFFNQKQT
jgi:hypothetical protein